MVKSDHDLLKCVNRLWAWVDCTPNCWHWFVLLVLLVLLARCCFCCVVVASITSPLPLSTSPPRAIHMLFYKSIGVKTDRKRRIRAFNGFDPAVPHEKHLAKVGFLRPWGMWFPARLS
jgi:hypothetical protein